MLIKVIQRFFASNILNFKKNVNFIVCLSHSTDALKYSQYESCMFFGNVIINLDVQGVTYHRYQT